MEEEIDEEVLRIVAKMSHPRHAIFKAKEIKEEGNKFFRQKKFQDAALAYDTAFQFLGASEPMCEDDATLMVEVGTSLGLNLAACSLKLGDFIQTLTFCKSVLEFDPLNVEALFRRATALVKLDRMEEAIRDLERAVELDPENKEVYRELKKVKEGLSMKSSKASMEVMKSPRVEERSNMEGKGCFHNSSDRSDNQGSVSCTKNSVHEPVLKDIVDFMEVDGGIKVKSKEEGERMEIEPPSLLRGIAKPCQVGSCHTASKQTNMTCVEDRAPSPMKSPASIFNLEDHSAKSKSTITFSKRQDGQVMSLNKEAYQVLLKGKVIEVFDHVSMSYMKVKVRANPRESKGVVNVEDKAGEQNVSVDTEVNPPKGMPGFFAGTPHQLQHSDNYCQSISVRGRKRATTKRKEKPKATIHKHTKARCNINKRDIRGKDRQFASRVYPRSSTSCKKRKLLWNPAAGIQPVGKRQRFASDVDVPRLKSQPPFEFDPSINNLGLVSLTSFTAGPLCFRKTKVPSAREAHALAITAKRTALL